MNKILKILLLSDLFIISGFGLMSPIFAIFLKENLIGGTILAAGIAHAIYLLTKSIFQLFVSRWTDKEKGNKRELYTMILGSLIFTFIPLFYILAERIETIYILQFFYGLGAAIAYPGWMTIYTRFTDKNKEGFEWSFYNASVSLGSAATAAIGGYIAYSLGFNTLFVIVAIFSLIGTILLGNLFNQELIKQNS